MGAVGGAPRIYPPPTLTDGNKDSDFTPGGLLANQAGRVLITQGEEQFMAAELKRLKQQAATEHNRMLAAQEAARQVTSAVCSENDMLRAKLQQLGIDPNFDINLKSTPEQQGQPESARRVIQFPEKIEGLPKPHRELSSGETSTEN